MSRTRPPATRSYHHGDLRTALLRAGYDLAMAGGADAVTLRAATRLAGVSPTAAYRHFASHEDLRLAVSALAMAELARSIEQQLEEVTAEAPLSRARHRLAAVGDGYIRFALDSPGAFNIAMFGLFTMAHAFDPATAGNSGRTPFQLLTDAIADLAALGLVEPGNAEQVAVGCWSTVHGFATLATRGPLRELERGRLDTMGQALVRGVVESLAAPVTGRAG